MQATLILAKNSQAYWPHRSANTHPPSHLASHHHCDVVATSMKWILQLHVNFHRLELYQFHEILATKKNLGNTNARNTSQEEVESFFPCASLTVGRVVLLFGI